MVAGNGDGAWVDGQQRRPSERGKAARRPCGGGEAGRGTAAERGWAGGIGTWVLFLQKTTVVGMYVQRTFLQLNGIIYNFGKDTITKRIQEINSERILQLQTYITVLQTHL